MSIQIFYMAIFRLILKKIQVFIKTKQPVSPSRVISLSIPSFMKSLINEFAVAGVTFSKFTSL